MMRIEYFLLFELSSFLSLTKHVFCWRLDNLGIDENKIEIARIAVYGNRAFVAIPRVYQEQRVTLAELPWPERSLSTPLNTRPFPDLKTQSDDDCGNLLSAVTLDLDRTSARLYILDQGSTTLKCWPKIIVFDVNVNKMLLKQELRGLTITNQTSLIVDNTKAKSAGIGKVIIGNAGNNNSSLLLYDFSGQGWWKLIVTSNAQLEDNFVPQLDEPRYLNFNQLAISKSLSMLYATSIKTRELYSINLEDLQNMDEIPRTGFEDYDDVEATEVSVKYVGNKFGPSSAMYVDFRGSLYYFYARDYVVLKCNLEQPFVDENAEVLLQDEKLMPNVVQIFSGPVYQIWALNSKRNSQSSYTVKVKALRFI